MVNIAVLGYGTVGSGIVEVIKTNQKIVDPKANDQLHVKYVLDLRDFPGDPVEEILTHDFEDIINDPEVDIVAEAMGGLNPAFTFAKRTLEAGKNYCTSNKALVAAHGAELMQIAKDNHVNFMFEAAVGGGIPIIRPLYQCLTADDIVEITGIINGTTNYMLTKMNTEGVSYDAVLKQAQELGYAEADPTADVEGFDATRKIAILSSLTYGQQVDFEDIPTTGISKITDKDFAYANKLGLGIKLFASVRKQGDKIYSYVAPTMVSDKHPLFPVNGVLNGVLVRGNMLGDTMFFGSGAGKLPTASAVVSDIVEEAKNLKNTVLPTWTPEKRRLADAEDLAFVYFVRASKNAMFDAKNLFVPKEIYDDVVEGEFAFFTEKMSGKELAEKLAKMDGVLSVIRRED